MKVTIERIPESQVRLEIAAEAAEQDEAIERAYKKVARDIMVPGFRKGKAPRTMIERLYGRELFVEEANRTLMDDLYRRAIEQEDLIPVGDPAVDSIEPDPLSFTVVVPVYPTVEPGPYQNVRVDPVDASIDEETVTSVLESVRKQQSPWVDPAEARPPADGDQITVDILIAEGEDEFQPPSENAVFVLGETNFLTELREIVETLKVGESGSVLIEFIEDDERIAADDPRRGKSLTYTVALNGLKERELLPLDDEFAKTYASAESIAGLTDRIRANLHIERTREARTEAVATIVQQIGEGAALEIPAPMIEEALERRVRRLRGELQYNGQSLEAYLRSTQQSEEELREELRPSVASSLRSSLILREIAEREGIEVSDDDLVSEIEGIVAQAPEPGGAREAYLSNEYLRSAIRDDIFDQRLTDRLIDIATEGGSVIINGYLPPEPVTIGAPDADSDQPAGLEPEVDSVASVNGDENGDCPPGHPIKGNADSLIYHMPGDRSYGRTKAELCFASEQDAQNAGYRAGDADTSAG